MKAASFDARAGSDATRTWRRDMEHWQAEVQGFLTETLRELRDLAEALDAQVQQESATRVVRNATVLAEPAPVEQTAAAVAAKPQREARSEPPGSALSERIDTGVNGMPPVLISPPPELSRTESSDDRLAQLARRLEEKLERSSYRGT